MYHPHFALDAAALSIRHHGLSFLSFQRRYLAVGAMAFAGVMMSLPTLPASAEVIHEEVVVSTAQHLRIDRDVVLPVVERSNYAISYFSVIRSPVAPGTAISSGFGHRIRPCSSCSSDHHGVDYLPGLGTPVIAIADGVVTDLGNPSGALGVYLTIKHVIDGQTVYSTYGHLGYGSLGFRLGDSVKVGQVVGATGSTGQSTGPHLHFEIRLADGTAIDPVPWLGQHVNA